jgi:MoaA/NifB/PqqE/SkfB family radical SAM enzyme
MHVILPAFDTTGRLSLIQDLETTRTTPALALELTSRCNLRCVYCLKAQPEDRYRNGDSHDAPYMVFGADIPPEALEAALKGLDERKVEEVTINGHGETTTYPGWEKIASALIARGVRVILTTNFSKRFSDEEVAVLSRFHHFYISIDSSDPERMHRYRRKSRLDVMLDNLRRVREVASREMRSPPGVRFSIGLYEEVVPTIIDLARLAVEQKIEHVIFWNQYVYPQTADTESITPLSSLAIEAKRFVVGEVHGALKVFDSAGITYEFDADWLTAMEIEVAGDAPALCSVSSEIKPDTTRLCIEPWVFSIFQANGNIAPCWVRVASSRPVSSGAGLGGIIEGGDFRDLRRRLLTGDLDAACAGCHHKPLGSIEMLRRHVVDASLLQGRPRDEHDLLTVAETKRYVRALQFSHCRSNEHGLADRIRMSANQPHETPATLCFKKVDLAAWGSLAVEFFVDDGPSPPIEFTIACNGIVSGETLAIGRARVSVGLNAECVLDISGIHEKCDVVLCVSKVAASDETGWAWISYPLLTTADETRLLSTSHESLPAQCPGER